jgi:hypothetical protein
VNNLSHNKALVGVFYARPETTRKLLDSLRDANGASEYDFRFYCDLPKVSANSEIWLKHRQTVEMLKAFLIDYSGTLEVREENYGLSKNMIMSISQTLEIFETCVILEDDIVISKNCLRHFEKGLLTYSSNKQIWGIAGNSFLEEKDSFCLNDVYWLPIMTTWGWATWADRWKLFLDQYPISEEEVKHVESSWGFDFGGFPYKQMLRENRAGKVDSWDIEYNFALYCNGGYFAFPRHSMCENIGVGADATHTKEEQPFMQKNS